MQTTVGAVDTWASPHVTERCGREYVWFCR